MSDEDKNSEPESNVWASYSDLFTNVAIVFLVMFVFALIKATVSQIQTVKTKIEHKNELKAKLNSKDLKKNKERIAKIEATMTEMKKYEGVINQKVQDLNDYAKQLQKNKTLLKEMVASQAKQDSIVKVVKEKLIQKEKEIDQKNKELESTQERIRSLNQEIATFQDEIVAREENNQLILEKKEQALKDLNFEIQKLKKSSQTKSQRLNSKLKHTETQLTKIQAEKKAKDELLTQKNLEMMKSQKRLEKLKNELELKLIQSSKELASLKQQEESLDAKLKKEKEYRSQQDNLISSLHDKLKKVDNELLQSKGSAKKLADERFHLALKLESLEGQHQALTDQYNEVAKKISDSTKRNGELEKQLKELSSKVAATERMTNQWKGKYENQLGALENLKKQLNQSNLRFKRLTDTLGKLKDAVKNGVALKLRDKFKENGLKAKVDLKTGEVVLLSGEGFNFEKGSARLSKEAKNILKKIIPIYAEVLLGDDKVYKQISSINMEGHSSPSFGGKYVSLTEFNPQAYRFNMRLSSLRASSVAGYLMSKEIGDYPHKEKMKILLQSVGFGYMRPIAKDLVLRKPASSSVKQKTARESCGPWDCYKSQRVQINFILKDNMERIKKIIDANGEIK